MLRQLKHIDDVIKLYPKSRVHINSFGSLYIESKCGHSEYIINVNMVEMMRKRLVLDVEKTVGESIYDYHQQTCIGMARVFPSWNWLEEWFEDEAVEWLDEGLFEI